MGKERKKLIIAAFILFSMVCGVCRAYADDTRQQLSAAEQRKFDYFYYEGVKLKNAGKFDASYEMFKHCLSIDSTSTVALFELSSYYIQLNRPQKAVDLMKKSIKYSPDNQEYRRTLATLLLSSGMFGEAAEEYKILVSIFPDKPEFYYYLAESLTRSGEIEKAIDAYNAMENLMGINEALSMEKYQLYMSIKQSDKAFDELKTLAEKFPMESRYMIIIGDLYLQQSKLPQALNYYNKAREIDPESPYYPVSMAHYYELTSQRDSAKQMINNALTNERLDFETKMNILARYIVQLRRTEKSIDEADVLFKTLLEQHPEESQLKLAYGEFLALQNKLEEARFQYRLVTESEPENVGAWLQLASLSIQLQDMDDAISLCLKCRELFPETLEFYLYMGIAYFQKKDYQSAIDTYLSAIQAITAENQAVKSDFYGQIGDSYFRMKDMDKAFEAYEEALKYNDKNINVLNNYAYYLSLLKKDLTKAERMSAVSIKMEPENATYIDTYAWIFFVQGNYILAKIYIEQALSKDRTNSSELVDHYGDILFKSGDEVKALEQWIKAKELGKKSKTLDKKISEKTYFEETREELFNNMENEEDGT
ncbi:MAG: tetratricopeptide repeat protein [Tannerella sp.]|jgi:tetratricopeptide (TPR) repeat protein|nr:tetratricopeptide repeat protein [Tannerella sp.]